ncbi:MAG TPA: aminotransferase class IV [Candidatus Polarisedimenticolia bacterium]|nr:aminotransferase class IV [Candidatus Polarisedimenticolia bacterium]
MRIHLNGRLVEEDEARVSVFDRGFLYGDGVFESMRAVAGVVFRQDRHLERLMRSAEGIGLSLAPLSAGLPAAIRELLAANELRDARLRITVTRGDGRPGEYVEALGPPTVVISAAAFESLDESMYRSGVGATIPRRRQTPPEVLDPAIKSISRLGSVLARREARDRGGFEALLLDAGGHLTEGTVSNLFLVARDRLLTAPTPAGGLPGITRETVIELARAAGIEVSEERLPASLLRECQEAFLTNSSWEVLPVVRVDDQPIGEGIPGPVTRDLLAAYRDRVRLECVASAGAGVKGPAS